MRLGILAMVAFLPTGCGVFGCTLIGCASSVTIDVVDAGSANRDLNVAVTVGDEVTVCSGTFDPVDGLFCAGLEVFPTADGYAVVVPVAQEDDVSLTIERDGSVVFDDAIAVSWSDPTYPNGKGCGPECIDGTAEIEVP